jgi:ankyrin repeat protein
LLNNGADPNIPANDGTTPLMLAKRKGLAEIESMLRKAGATD